MLIKRPSDIPPSEITPRSIFHDRRRFMRDSAGIATTALLGASGLSLLGSQTARALATDKDATGQKLEGVVESAYRVDEELTPLHRHHELQQLLRVRNRQAGPRALRGRLHPAPMDDRGAR